MNNFGSVDQNFLTLVQLLVNQVLHNCLYLVPVFTLLGFGQSLLRIWSDGPSFDHTFLLRGAVVFIIMFNYLEIIDLISGGIEAFKNVIPQPTGILSELNEFSSSIVSLKPEEPDPNASTVDQVLDYVQGAFNFNFGFTHFFVSLFEEGLTMIIRIGYEKIRVMLLAFITVAGPLSLTLSVIPGFEKLGGIWFKGWFHVHMWSVTLRILDSIIITYNQTVFSTAMNNGDTAFVDTIIVNIVCLFMYLMVPTLTSYFAGQAMTSGFLSKLAGLVGATAMLAGKMMSGSSVGGSSQTATPATAGAGSWSYGGGGGSPIPPFGSAPMLPTGNSPAGMLGMGGTHLLGGGSPLPLPPGPMPMPPLQGGSAHSIPIRQMPSPQPRIAPVQAPAYAPFEIVS